MKRKSLYIFAFLILAILITTLKEITDEEESFIPEKVKFARWDSDIKLSDTFPERSLNLVFIAPPSAVEHIEGISLKDTEKIKLIEYQIEKGDEINDKYSLFTLIATIGVANVIEQISETIQTITIRTEDQSEYDFTVGNIQVSTGLHENLLEVVDSYRVLSSKLTFDVKLRNSGEDSITLKELFIDNKHLQFNTILVNGKNFDTDVVIQPDEMIRLTANFHELEGDVDFYQITPTLHYEMNGESYTTNIESTLYYDMDEETINRIIGRK
ncbi:hypothetical protein [Fervidibacillus albus]|uniref:Uncharacterized protein n=1 Tax=Fervidibacillus albus TaxID=2980026 RepID=A0A9E8RVK3_9BACI|nr:hypothetical protein [Fervidibacillus albus]WAA09571.1 hypothetical protein OE104_13740 [Fervidibacillus albus]